MSPESALQYWRFNLDHSGGSKELFDFVQRYVRPGDVVWDVGANCGVFSVAAAGLAGAGGLIVAVEPDPYVCGLLCQSASVQGSSRGKIEVMCCAAAEEVGAAVLNIANRGRSTNFLDSVAGRPDSGGVRSTQRVLTVTLDWLLGQFPAPRILKIDVEGAEVNVLRAAGRVLQSGRPIVLCEVGEESRREVEAILLANGYRLSALGPNAMSSDSIDSANIIGVPC